MQATHQQDRHTARKLRLLWQRQPAAAGHIVKALPESTGHACSLVTLGGFSVADAAQMMDKPPEVVDRLNRQGLAMLRELARLAPRAESVADAAPVAVLAAPREHRSQRRHGSAARGSPRLADDEPEPPTPARRGRIKLAAAAAGSPVSCPRCLNEWGAKPEAAAACERSLVCPNCLLRFFAEVPLRQRRYWGARFAIVDTLMRVGLPGTERNAHSARALLAQHDPYEHDPASGARLQAQADKRSRNPDGVLVDFLATGGWHITKGGATGNPVGRRTRGVTSPKFLLDQLQAALPHGLTVEAAAKTLRRGRLTTTEQRHRRALAAAIAELFDSSRKPNRKAMAALLACSHQTIGALLADGRAQIDKNSPKGGEVSKASAYWAFRANPSLVTGRVIEPGSSPKDDGAPDAWPLLGSRHLFTAKPSTSASNCNPRTTEST